MAVLLNMLILANKIL